MNTEPASYWAILTFGPIIEGRRRSFYRSEAAARRDAERLVGPSTIRVGQFPTRQAAISADISD